MISRPLLSLTLTAGVVALVARMEGTQNKASAAPTPYAVRNELVRSQEALARKFRDFRAILEISAGGPSSKVRVS